MYTDAREYKTCVRKEFEEVVLVVEMAGAHQK